MPVAVTAGPALLMDIDELMVVRWTEDDLNKSKRRDEPPRVKRQRQTINRIYIGTSEMSTIAIHSLDGGRRRLSRILSPVHRAISNCYLRVEFKTSKTLIKLICGAVVRIRSSMKEHRASDKCPTFIFRLLITANFLVFLRLKANYIYRNSSLKECRWLAHSSPICGVTSALF